MLVPSGGALVQVLIASISREAGGASHRTPGTHVAKGTQAHVTRVGELATAAVQAYPVQATSWEVEVWG